MSQVPEIGQPAANSLSANSELDARSSYGPLHPLAVWKRLRRDRLALFGGFLVCCFIFIAIFAPVIAPYSPRARDTKRMNEAPFWLNPPANTASEPQRNLFGRDVQGRDVFSRVIYGTQTSLCIGVAVVSLSSLIGITLGSLAGYVGGFVETLIMRTVDVILAFPFLILALAIVSIIPHVTVYHVALVLGCTSWPGIARLMRGQVLATRELDYVKAAEALGAGHRSILFGHILPNCIAPVIISFTMGIAGAVMAEASLSFLGMGDPDSLGWGALIDIGLTKANFPTEWWAVTFPALALAVFALGFNLLGDGLQDAINPKLKN